MKNYHVIQFHGIYSQFTVVKEMLTRTFKSCYVAKNVIKQNKNFVTFKVANN